MDDGSDTRRRVRGVSPELQQAAKLVIELDGDVHDLSQAQDQARTKHLEAYGCYTLRFRSEEVFSESNRVFIETRHVIQALTPPELGAGGPLEVR